MSENCFVCRLTKGIDPLPGGRIYATTHWVVEHCIGPLGIGTLIVKPFRHCLQVGNLTHKESQELGPLLQKISEMVQELTGADQVYVCLWSHAGWEPVHIHFVIQPAWNNWRDIYENSGPGVQMDMFQKKITPTTNEIEAFCLRARTYIQQQDKDT